MKADLYILIILILSALMGCSENNSPYLPDLINDENKFKNDNTPVFKRCLLFEHEGLSISANGERIVNSELLTQVLDMRHANLLITFTGWTNADTTCYVSQLSIENESNVILLESGEQYINRYHELNIENFNQGIIRFYIVLWCDEVICNSTAKLIISNIKIYGY